MKKIIYLFIFLIPLSSSSQNKKDQVQIAAELWDIEKKLNSYSVSSYAETIYLHTDRTVYNPGDTIWFKAYILDQFKQKFCKSYTLAVSLFNEKNQNIISEHFTIKNASSYGQLIIPTSLEVGEYALIALTGFMIENKLNEYFLKKIKISSQVKTEPTYLLNFKESAYNIGDSLYLELIIKDYFGNLMPNVRLNYQLRTEDTVLISDKTKLNKQSKAHIYNIIPEYNIKERLFVDINIPSKKSSKRILIPVNNNKINIHFFPESGYLINGINNKVAFKAVRNNGSPVQISGKILDENKNLISLFTSNSEGLGIFSFTPDKLKKYKIELDSNFNCSNVILPEIVDEGIVLNIDNNNPKILKALITPSKLFENKDYYLLIHNKTSVLSGTQILRGKKLIEIDKSILPKGICCITVFDRNNIPYAERLFLNSLDIKAGFDIDLENLQDSIQISFSKTKDDFNKEDVSISVYFSNSDFTNNQKFQQDNILSYFLLSSELKGKIPESLFYFNGSGKGSERLIDLVLLTNGWRKYNWKEIDSFLKTDKVDNQFDENISGFVLDSRNKPLKNASIYVTNINDYNLIFGTKTDQFGKFNLSRKYFNSHQDNIILGLKGSNQKLKIELNDYYQKNIDEIAIKSKLKNRLKNHYSYNDQIETINISNSRLIEEIDVFEKQNVKTNETKYTSIFNAVDIKSKVFQDKHIGNQYFLDLLNEVAPPNKTNVLEKTVHYRPRIKHPLLIGKLDAMNGGTVAEINQDKNAREPGVLFVVNDVPIGNSYENLEMLTRTDIKSISVLKNPIGYFYYGEKANGGIVFVETRTEIEKTEYSFEPAQNLYLPKLYSKQKEFYKPLFLLEEEANMNKYVTIYWNPNFDIENNLISWKVPKGEYLNKNIIISIEGINKEGTFICEHEKLRIKTE